MSNKYEEFNSIHPRLLAWGMIHDSHGLVLDHICFLIEGDKPDNWPIGWERLPWLDQPKQEEKTII